MASTNILDAIDINRLRYMINSTRLSRGKSRLPPPPLPECIHTTLLDGETLTYCIDCIRPHVHRLCDGRIDPKYHYKQCSMHSDPSVPTADDPIASHDSESDSDSDSDVPNFTYSSGPVNNHKGDELDPDRYVEIREAIGLEKMAVQVAGFRQDYKLSRNFTSECGAYARDQIGRAMDEMLKPRNVHGKGCLHSEKPEMIIQTEDVESREDAGTRKEDGRSKSESGLASSLYFKRCDGVFKNSKGEVLNRCSST